jgi:hypothetical protein
MTLNPGLLPRRIITRDASWADPLIAARYHRELGNGFGVTGYADVGGFGAGADLDWQLLGTVDYAYNFPCLSTPAIAASTSITSPVQDWA